MSLKTDAESIHRQVRQYFKGKLKSANKKYFVDKTSESVEDSLFDNFDLFSKEGRRNDNANLAANLIARLQSTYRQGFDRGAAVASTQLNANRVGNCTEMANMAAWIIATQKTHYTAFMCGITPPGDHALCVVVDKPPGRCDLLAFENVSKFANDKSGAYVIDPWANVCCPLTEYAKVFQDKMQKWTAGGKRIYYSPSKQTTGRWAAPASTTYINGFLTGPVRFFKVEASKGVCHPAPVLKLDPLLNIPQDYWTEFDKFIAISASQSDKKKNASSLPDFQLTLPLLPVADSLDDLPMRYSGPMLLTPPSSPAPSTGFDAPALPAPPARGKRRRQEGPDG